MLLRQPRKPHVGMLGPSRRMIVDNLGFSPLAGNHAKGHTDPARGLCAALLLQTAVDLAVACADRVALKVQ